MRKEYEQAKEEARQHRELCPGVDYVDVFYPGIAPRALVLNAVHVPSVTPKG